MAPQCAPLRQCRLASFLLPRPSNIGDKGTLGPQMKPRPDNWRLCAKKPLKAVHKNGSSYCFTCGQAPKNLARTDEVMTAGRGLAHHN